MEKNRKCVMVMDEALAPGIAANTAALLGMTLGSRVQDAIGCDVKDADGHTHMGILQIPLPILKLNTERLQELPVSCLTRNMKILPSWISAMQHKPAMCMRIGSKRQNSCRKKNFIILVSACTGIRKK